MCAKGIAYDYLCMLPASTCTEERKIAAVYDYAGAVYGEEGKVKYDHVLTLGEAEYVKERFGQLTSSSDAARFLSGARKKFLPKDLAASACSPENFALYRHWNSELGIGVNLGTEHECAEYIGDIYGYMGIEQAVAASPSSWQFMLETNEDAGVQQGDMTRELAMFHRIAKALNIPVGNPVLPVYNEKVLKVVEERLGMPPLAVAVQFATTTFFDVSRFGTINDKNVFEVIQKVAEEIAAIFRVDAKELEGVLVRNLTRRFEGVSVAAMLKTLLTLAQTKISEVAEISNALSIDSTKKSLLKHPDRTNSFFLVGALHMPIAESVYQEKEGLYKLLKSGLEWLLNPSQVSVSML